MKTMSPETIAAINSARFFATDRQHPEPPLRPWQMVRMAYERVGLTPPARIPDFSSMEDAEIWMCLDSRYNYRLRESACRMAG
jgi:hypothetical protein